MINILSIIYTISIATGLCASSTSQVEQGGLKVTSALYDGKCFYPIPDPHFTLQEYLGFWYQVAGTPFDKTAGARCVTAEYQLNDNGTVKVINTARVGDGTLANNGTATPVAKEYGIGGAFQVSFPGFPGPECPGPNYIVQEYGGDYAIVQTAEWGVLYILSRVREPPQEDVNTWIERAVCLGSNVTAISKFDQKEC